jgi:hypothetical protein
MNKEYLNERLFNLKTFDKIRFHKIIQSVQYNILYIIIGGILGSLVEYIFPKYDENKTNFEIIKEILLQIILLSIVIYYISKIVKCIPYIGSFDDNYNPYQSDSLLKAYNGEIMIAIILIVTQINLIKKMRHITIVFLNKTGNIYNNFNKKKNTYENKETNQINPNQSNNVPVINKQNINEGFQNISDINNNINNEINPNNQLNSLSYSDRIHPIETRQVNNYNPMNQNKPFETDISSLKINKELTNSSISLNNSLDSLPTNNNQQALTINENFNSSNINDPNSITPKEKFNPLSTSGNFSFINDGKINNNNSTRTLNYSDFIN